MEVGTADRTSLVEKEKRWALKGHAQVNLLSYSMSRTMWASRHDLLVIPRYQATTLEAPHLSRYRLILIFPYLKVK
jgi:hypothetical protein